MNINPRDIRSTIIPRSDQLNADQLITGPLIITITSVDVLESREQPVVVHYEGENGRPYKPCLTMRRVLVLGWGHDPEAWLGRSMELFHDSAVRFGNETVGGIRISRMSDIPSTIEARLSVSKAKKALNTIEPLVQSQQLIAALEAIAAATGKESMKKARELSEKLAAEHELSIARVAYARKAEALRAAVAPPPPAATDEHLAESEE